MILPTRSFALRKPLCPFKFAGISMHHLHMCAGVHVIVGGHKDIKKVFPVRESCNGCSEFLTVKRDRDRLYKDCTLKIS